MVGILMENNVGFASPVNTLIAGVIKLPDIQKSVSGLGAGWSKATLLDNWLIKAAIARVNFTK